MQNIKQDKESWIFSLQRGILQWESPTEAALSTALEEKHLFPEAFFQLSGKCSYFLNAEEHLLLPGTCCFIRAGIPHQNGFLPGKSEICEQLWFHGREFYCNIIRSRPDASCYLVYSFSLPESFRRFGEYLLTSPATTGEQCLTFFRLILQEAAVFLGKDGGETNQLIPALECYIRSRNGRECSMAVLEKFFGYSRSHLAHQYHAGTGRSIGEFINQVRLEVTEERLREGAKQKEIAAELGFSSSTAFWLWRERLRRKGDR